MKSSNSGPATRLSRLSDKLSVLGVDAILVTDPINVRYLSGFTGDSSYLLVTAIVTTVLSDGRYETQLKGECPDLVAQIRPPSMQLSELVQAVLNDSGLKQVAVEADHLSASAMTVIQERCELIHFAQTSGVVERLRAVKDSDEIAITRKAVEIAERAFESVRPMLSSRWTERDVAHELEAKIRFLGGDRCSFAPIVAVDESSALPHYRPSDRSLDGASVVLIDWGAEFDGYASDITRTLCNDKGNEKYRRAYDAVLEAQLAAIGTIRPGVAARDVDAAARTVLEKHGLADAFKHSTGHGTGLEIHELPRLSALGEDELAAGMIVTVEPGVYFEGGFGIRLEDDVLVTEAGSEVLSRLPKGLDDCRFIM